MNQPNPPPVASYYTPPPQGAAPNGPLTPEQVAEIAQARQRYRKVRRAVGVATFDAWTTAIFAGLTLMCTVLSFSIPGFLVGAGMAVVAWNSFRGMKLLGELDEQGARVLGWNQILLGSVLLLYAVWNLIATFAGQGATQTGALASARGDLSAAGLDADQIDQWVRLGGYVLYGALALFAIICQGLTSLYYFGRAKVIRAYAQGTPQWVLQMQKAGFRF